MSTSYNIHTFDSPPHCPLLPKLPLFWACWGFPLTSLLYTCISLLTVGECMLSWHHSMPLSIDTDQYSPLWGRLPSSKLFYASYDDYTMQYMWEYQGYKRAAVEWTMLLRTALSDPQNSERLQRYAVEVCKYQYKLFSWMHQPN